MLAATVVYVLRWSRFNDIGRPARGRFFWRDWLAPERKRPHQAAAVLLHRM